MKISCSLNSTELLLAKIGIKYPSVCSEKILKLMRCVRGYVMLLHYSSAVALVKYTSGRGKCFCLLIRHSALAVVNI